VLVWLDVIERDTVTYETKIVLIAAPDRDDGPRGFMPGDDGKPVVSETTRLKESV